MGKRGARILRVVGTALPGDRSRRFGGEDVILVQESPDPGGPSTVTAADITDATAVGRSVMTAADAGAARSAVGAGTSSLVLGTTGTTAAAGNHTQAATTVNVAADATNGVAAGNAQATISALAARIKALEDAAP